MTLPRTGGIVVDLALPIPSPLVDPHTGMPRVGMVGGGQLARMTHQSAIALGQTLRVLSVSPTDGAALVTPEVAIGSHTDLAALRAFAADCEVLTFDHELVPTEHIRALAADGIRVYPGADALQFAQDKGLMRVRLAELGLPVPHFALIPASATAAECEAAMGAFAAEHGPGLVVKAARGGYDGRGVRVLPGGSDFAAIAADWAGTGDLVLEELVPLRRELAAVIARSPFGQAAGWPVVETVQQDGICVEVVAPAQDLPDHRATAAAELALRLAGELGMVGVMAVELFEVEPSERYPDGLVINELAMRPHNSAHWTMDGAVTSQFEQHLRAVLDYPLGSTAAIFPVTVMGNVIGGPADSPGAHISMDERVHHLAARFPAVKVHLYGKEYRPGRKLGHVNLGGHDVAETRRIARLAAEWLNNGVWADGWSAHGTSEAPTVVTRGRQASA